MSGMTPRLVVFDFGNVVGLFSHCRSAAQVAALGEADADAVLAFLYGGDLEHAFDGGMLEAAAYRDLVCGRFGLACDADAFDRALGDMFTRNEEVIGLLPALKRRHRLLLLSNTNAIHLAQIRRQFGDVLTVFDHHVFSHEVKMRKPEERIYRHCERLAEARPEECLLIDDMSGNVEGARACGWRGIVYRPGDDLAAALDVDGVTRAL
jgi:putative hydrolase of the HAD superfamily